MPGEVSLFALSASNAVVQMLGRGGPRVVSAQSDGKRELEAQLKAACESFIMVRCRPAVVLCACVFGVRVCVCVCVLIPKNTHFNPPS